MEGIKKGVSSISNESSYTRMSIYNIINSFFLWEFFFFSKELIIGGVNLFCSAFLVFSLIGFNDVLPSNLPISSSTHQKLISYHQIDGIFFCY